MTSGRMARECVQEAVFKLSLIERCLASGRHGRAVRLSQEAVELALKGLPRAAGTEPPQTTS